MATADIFTQIAQLFQKTTPDGDVQVFVMHRFFSSDPAYAPVAKEFSRLYDDQMVVELWRSVLPKRPSSPFFKYPAPKKVASVEVVKKVAETEGYNYAEAEEAVLLLDALGMGDRLQAYYGLEDPKPAKKGKK